jgi:hypothetical protein
MHDGAEVRSDRSDHRGGRHAPTVRDLLGRTASVGSDFETPLGLPRGSGLLTPGSLFTRGSETFGTDFGPPRGNGSGFGSCVAGLWTGGVGLLVTEMLAKQAGKHGTPGMSLPRRSLSTGRSRRVEPGNLSSPRGTLLVTTPAGDSDQIAHNGSSEPLPFPPAVVCHERLGGLIRHYARAA